jgi:hypothetical protein
MGLTRALKIVKEGISLCREKHKPVVFHIEEITQTLRAQLQAVRTNDTKAPSVSSGARFRSH